MGVGARLGRAGWQWRLGATVVVPLLVAVVAGVAGASRTDPAPVGDHAQTLVISPADVRPGQELRVSVSAPDRIQTLLLARWDGHRFRETYAAQGSSWRQVAADGQKGFYLALSTSGRASEHYVIRLSGSARPGSYRVCTVLVDACTDLTIR